MFKLTQAKSECKKKGLQSEIKSLTSVFAHDKFSLNSNEGIILC